MVGWNLGSYEFEHCAGGTAVQFDLVSDMGHEWPVRVDELGEAQRWADLMSTTTIAMEFFAAHPAG